MNHQTGTVVLAGNAFGTTIDFGHGAVGAAIEGGGFVVATNPALQCVASALLTGSEKLNVRTLALDDYGNAIVGGYVTGDLSVGDVTPTGAGGAIFVAKIAVE